MGVLGIGVSIYWMKMANNQPLKQAWKWSKFREKSVKSRNFEIDIQWHYFGGNDLCFEQGQQNMVYFWRYIYQSMFSRDMLISQKYWSQFLIEKRYYVTWPTYNCSETAL